MSRTLREKLVELASQWRMPEPSEPKPPTFESVRDHIEHELRLRAQAGCSTWGGHFSTSRFGGGIGCLGTTGDPDKDEVILRRVALWLGEQGLTVEVKRHDTPDTYDDWYHETEPGYSSTYIDVRWR